MSYILDALKRADAERERGAVPGLHSQSLPLRQAVADSRAVAKPLTVVGAMLALLVLGVLGVLGWRSSEPGLVTTRSGMPDIAASPPPANQIAAAAPVMAVTPAAVDTSGSVAPVPTPVAVPAHAPPASAMTTRPAAPTASPRPAPVSRPAVNVNELPAQVRQTLPKVVISGSTHSDNRALRMLIVNGEVFREGESPAPGLQLEQIGNKSAVLNFKGLRYAVVY